MHCLVPWRSGILDCGRKSVVMARLDMRDPLQQVLSCILSTGSRLNFSRRVSTLVVTLLSSEISGYPVISHWCSLSSSRQNWEYEFDD